MKNKHSFIKATVRYLVWNKLTLANVCLIVFLALLSLVWVQDLGIAVKAWPDDAGDFGLPVQILIALAVLICMSGVGIVTTFQLTKLGSTEKHTLYVKYTMVMFFIALFSALISITCPTIKGLEGRLMTFASISIFTGLFSWLNLLITFLSFSSVTKSESSKANEKTEVSIFEQSPVNFFQKAMNGKYTDCNRNTLKLFGLDSKSQFCGKETLQLLPKAYHEQGMRVLANDAEVTTNKTIVLTVEKGFNKDNQPTDYISLKIPWIKEERVIGLFGLSFEKSQARIDLAALKQDE